jgi:hypothetical protein
VSSELCTAYIAFRDRLKHGNIDGVNVIENIGGLVGPKDLPRIDILGFVNFGGKDNDAALTNRAAISFKVMLRLREETKKGMTTDGKERGILWLTEQTLNAIYAADQLASGSWGMVPICRVAGSAINETEYTMDLEVELTTARFTRGEL